MVELKLGVGEMKFRVVLEYDSKSNNYAVYCPEWPGCCSAGDTEQEAVENIKEAIELYLEPSPLKLGCTNKEIEIEVPVK